MILAGDIGGSKLLFGLFDGARCVAERRLASADFADFAAALECCLDSFPRSGITAVCFAVAGPVDAAARWASLTNRPWIVDAAALEARFELPPIVLVNDFSAAAQGAVSAGPDALITLQAGAPLAAAPRLVVGAGTGLGMAVVLPQDEGWRIVPGEGGHVAFAPADAEQAALWLMLHARHGRVSWEHVVSGPGLAAIHAFLSGKAECDPAAISRRALHSDADTASAEARALALFLTLYGAFAGDMALTVLPRGGVFLAGGIAGQILPALFQANFLAAFNAKAEHAALVAQMPVHVCIDPALGLRGAAALAMLK